MIRLDAISKQYPNGQVAVARAVARHPRRRDLRARRPVGLRQDHHVEDDQPAHRAHVGPHLPRRQRRHPRRPGRAAPPHRLRDPAGRAVPAPDHRHQHRHRAEAARLVEGAHRRPRRRAARPRRASIPPTTAIGYPPQLSGGQRQRVGVGAGARRRSAGPPDGRAVRRHRPGRRASGCRTSSCACSARCRRRWCS